MRTTTKVRILSYLAFFFIFIIIWIILHYTFENLENPYKGMITAGITAIFSPRINEYKTQSGNKMQLKWIFLKKTISI